VNGGAAYEVCMTASMCQIGITGGKGGEMSSPAGVATDAAGNVYVADAGNNRIQKFDSSGTWISAWGKNVNGGSVYGVCMTAPSCSMGTAGGFAGEMDSPEAIAADASGHVYVADTNNYRVQKFDSSGAWERTWGKGVNGGSVFGICTSATTCIAGGSGSLGGEIGAGLYGIAADTSGHVFIGEEFTASRVQEYDASGNWVRAWGKNVNGGGVFGICTVAANCLAGDSGGLGGEFNSAFGVATDGAGGIYAVDSDNNRVQKFVLTPDPPSPPPPAATGPTGQRAAALKKCKKKRSQKARKKCKRKAKRLPA
jgi:phosphotransferase system HPr-like phosphotransfer protein